MTVKQKPLIFRSAPKHETPATPAQQNDVLPEGRLSKVAGRNVSVRIWKRAVIEALKAMPNYTMASKKAGISYKALEKYRQRHPEFQRECDLAISQSVQLLEAHVWKRATTGWTRPVFMRNSKGDPIQVGEEPLYDSKLAELLLRAHRPDKYNPKQNISTEISGPGGVPLSIPPTVQNVVFCLPSNNRADPAHIGEPPLPEITDVEQVVDGSK